MTDFQSIVVNDLAKFSFIAGTEQILTFDIYDANKQAVDLSFATLTWTMSYFNDPTYAVLTKTGVIDAQKIYRFSVTIASADTLTLSGTFVHQPVVVDYLNNEYRPSQGSILIIPRIATI